LGGVATAWQSVAHGTFLRDTGPANLVLLGLLLVAAVFTGRAFCGWACPLGTVQEWIARLAKRLTGGRKAWLPIFAPHRLDRPLRLVKYVLLGWVVWQSATAVLPPLQPFCPYRTLFTLNTRSLIGWSVLAGFVTLSLVVEHFWCRYLCPLGAILAITNKISLWRIRVDRARCTSCGRCDRACPIGLDVVNEVERGLECTRCGACIKACPRQHVLSS
jgi:polyferredoxin